MRRLARVAPVREQPGHIVADGVAADLDPAVVAVGRRAGLDAAAGGWSAKKVSTSLKVAGPVRLQRQEIVAATAQDGAGDLGLGADGVDRDQGPLERQPLQAAAGWR